MVLPAWCVTAALITGTAEIYLKQPLENAAVLPQIESSREIAHMRWASAITKEAHAEALCRRRKTVRATARCSASAPPLPHARFLIIV